AADAIRGLVDRRSDAGVVEVERGSEAGEAAADDHDLRIAVLVLRVGILRSCEPRERERRRERGGTGEKLAPRDERAVTETSSALAQESVVGDLVLLRGERVGRDLEEGSKERRACRHGRGLQGWGDDDPEGKLGANSTIAFLGCPRT